MLKILEIDNLTGHGQEADYSDLANEIADLVNRNISFSNDGAYDEIALNKLRTNKTQASTLEMIKESYLICIYEEDTLIACGFSKIQDGRYFSKSLHVHPDFRGRGLARFICDEREDFLKTIGAKEIFIESLKFQNTIQFHKSRGFHLEPPYRELKNTILMKKKLT